MDGRQHDMAGALGSAVAELEAYLPTLEALVPREQPPAGVPAAAASAASSPPWYAPAANVLMGIHADARRIEQEMRQQIAGQARPRRGGSGANTVAALEDIGSLAFSVTYSTAARATHDLARWVHRAAQLPDIDDEPQWVPIAAGAPSRERQPGEQPALCPYCLTPSLRYAKLSAQVRCFLAGCADSNGDQPQGRPGYVRGEPAVLWQDGLVT